MSPPDAIATFRERLLGLRAALLQQLAKVDHLDAAGLLATLAALSRDAERLPV